MNDREAKIRELIDLKKREAEALKIKDDVKNGLMLVKIRADIELLLKNADDYVHEFSKLNADEMQSKLDLELKKKSDPQHPLYSSTNLQLIIDAYNQKFCIDNAYKSGYGKPNEQGGCLTLQFPTEKDEVAFDLEMAVKKISFKIIDPKTQLVIAYSNGDGKLYHGDDKEFNVGDSYYRSPQDKSRDVFLEQSKHPSP